MVPALQPSNASHAVKWLPRLLAACITVWAVAMPCAKAQDAHARFLLTSSQIVDAMQDRNFPTRGVQIKIAIPITSVVASPALEIQAASPLSAQVLRLRMVCRDRSECLPFFALATYTEAIDPTAFQAKNDHQPATVEKFTNSTSLVTQSLASPPFPKQPLNPGEAPLLRSGSPATLDFDGDRIHVRVEVICLESGATGDRIRVTTRDRKQTYVAEIVAPNVLKGTLTR